MALRLIRALPGERRCLPPSQGGPYHPLDATVAAPGPHDFAVRYWRFRRAPKHLTPQASIATRATLRDDRETSLMAARAESEDSSDLRNSQEGISYFRNIPLSSLRTQAPITSGCSCSRKAVLQHFQ